MHISIIVAAAENGIIGRGGTLPWRLSLQKCPPIEAPDVRADWLVFLHRALFHRVRVAG